MAPPSRLREGLGMGLFGRNGPLAHPPAPFRTPEGAN